MSMIHVTPSHDLLKIRSSNTRDVAVSYTIFQTTKKFVLKICKRLNTVHVNVTKTSLILRIQMVMLKFAQNCISEIILHP